MSATLDDPARDELRLLAMQLLDRTISSDEARHLFGLLRTSPAARLFYLQEINLSGGIYWDNTAELRATLNHRLAERYGAPLAASDSGIRCDAAARAAGNEPSVPISGQQTGGTIGPRPGLGLGFLQSIVQVSLASLSSPKTLAVGVTGGLLAYFAMLAISIVISRAAWSSRAADGRASVSGDSGTRAGDAAPAPGNGVGSLTADRGTRWSRASAAAEDRIVRSGQHYELSQGAVRMLLANGASVVVEGPATWRLASEGRLLLDSGKLFAHIPQSAVGFTVVTPMAEFIDLGTEFGVVVNDRDESQLAVTKGAVRLVVRNDLELKPGRSAPSPMRVTAGEAVTVSRSASGAAVTKAAVSDAGWSKQIAHLNEPHGKSLRRRSVAYQTWPENAAGNQFDFAGSLGLDFKVSRPIRVFSLGVFDHLGDGIDPSSAMTVQLWSRDTHKTEDLSDDTGDQVLASAEMTADAPGELKFGHRFVALAEPVILQPGDYAIVAHGFSPNNPDLNFGFGPASTAARSEVDTARFTIVPLGSRALAGGAAGVFPSKHEQMTVRYCAGSFEFERED